MALIFVPRRKSSKFKWNNVGDSQSIVWKLLNPTKMILEILKVQMNSKIKGVQVWKTVNFHNIGTKLFIFCS